MNHMHLFKETLLIIAFFLITLLGHGQTIVATDFNREQPWFKDYRPEEKWNDLFGKCQPFDAGGKGYLGQIWDDRRGEHHHRLGWITVVG